MRASAFRPSPAPVRVPGALAVAAGAGGHAGVKSPFALVHEIREWFDGPLALAPVGAWLAVKGAEAILKAREMKPEQIIEEVKTSARRGRGGADGTRQRRRADHRTAPRD